MTRRHRLLFLPLVLAGLAAAPAAYAAEAPALVPRTVLDASLTAAAGEAKAFCHAGSRPGAAGVASRTLSVPGAGRVDVRLLGDDGDWDVAVFDATGRVVAAGAGPDARESAQGWATTAGTLRVQACRRTGDAASVPVQVDFAPIPKDVSAYKAAAPQLVDVITPTREAKARATSLGLDLSEEAGAKSVGVVLHGEADRDTLRKAGLQWRVIVPDMVAQDAADRTAEARYARRATRSSLPSGRDSYRTLADYNAELKDLAAKNPDLVRLVVLPNKTLLGKSVMGVEITENVNRADGKPSFLNLGVHHSREWPAGEHPMEWAIELVKGYKSGDARATKIVRQSRNIVVPIVNPDGFDASRTAGALAGANGGRDESVPDTAYIVAGASTGGEYRRKNCRLPDDSDGANCATSPGLMESGVDPNRNYGAFWGGPGASASILDQTYRGKGPFSEPETRNIQALVSRNQVMTLITNHTTAGLVLRAPGIAALGDPVDENRGYKALGDAMAKENGYFSQKSFELYDTTGTTEDWSYNTTGGYGFTFEIYCGDPNYETGDCDDPAFHPSFATMIKEWDGTSAQADHKGDPAFPQGYDGKGNREAYYIAAESTIDEARHSVLEGDVTPGVTLRLRKDFRTQSFPQPQESGDDKPIEFDDHLETTYDVGPSGKIRWHVNPSTRPVVAKDQGDPNGGTPSPPEQRTGSPQGNADDPTSDGAIPNPSGESATTTPLNWNDHPITIPATGDNRSANIRVKWTTPASDYDIEIFDDVNGNGKSDAGDKSLGTSAQGATTEEEVGLTGTPKLQPGKKYVLRVTNFAAGEPYTVDIKYAGPAPFRPAQVESYNLTCESNGKVLDSQPVQIDRGQVKQLELAGCARKAEKLAAVAPSGSPACIPSSGFKSVAATRSGRGLRLGFDRASTSPVTVDVFQQSRGRSVVRERLVARFADRVGSLTWNGRANRKGKRVTDGYYFVRYRIRTNQGVVDTRRVTLVRSGGRFRPRADFYRRATCDAVPSFKLTRPVFGGRKSSPLGISFLTAKPARVAVTVLRGSKVVRRFAERAVPANRTQRLTLSARGLPKGDYRVRLTARDALGAVTATLVSRRL